MSTLNCGVATSTPLLHSEFHHLKSHAAVGHFRLFGVFALVVMCTAGQANGEDPSPSARDVRALVERPFETLPMGSVQPQGWLQSQLQVQRDGLTGHLDEFWLKNSVWKGGDSELSREQLIGGTWGRGAKFMAVYLEGLAAVGFVLNDATLKSKAQQYINWILESRRPDGWFGLDRSVLGWNPDHMTEYNAILLMMLSDYYEVTEDPRVLPLMKGYFRFLDKDYESFGTTPHWNSRIKEHLVSAVWYYRHSGDPEVLPFIDKLNEKSFNWSLHFAHFPWTDPEHLPTNFGSDGATSHGYTIARALKYPALRFELTGDPFYRHTLTTILDVLDRYHGQVGGRYAADEHLAGRRPTQGTELCTIVLFMNSLERSFLTFGDPQLLDRLELLAFNALPGGMTPDCWAHQYDQQANQVVVSVAERDWQSNDRTANIYGLMPNYPCCLVGFHQGWPRYVQHMWLKTHDGGLCAAALGPCELQTTLPNGTAVTISESTEYPFDGTIDIEVKPARPTTFPLLVRIPAWSTGVAISVNGEAVDGAAAGEFSRLEREWLAGDRVQVALSMPLQTERRYRDAVAIRRGPLYFSLRIGKQYERTTFANERNAISIPFQGSVDWQIFPTTEWNYGLLVSEGTLAAEASIERHAISEFPFADRGEMVYSTERQAYRVWDQDAPVIITLPAQKISSWQMRNNSADDPPRGAISSNEPMTQVQLVPYGSARLRVSEFPLIDVK